MMERSINPIMYYVTWIEQLLGDANALAQLQTTWMGNDSYAALLQNSVLKDILQPLNLLTQFNDPNHIYAYSEISH